MKQKTKIDWDTVELVGDLVPAAVVPTKRSVLLPVKRADWSVPDPDPDPVVLTSKRSPDPRTKLILSGAAGKARSRGPSYTHTQLRKILPAGIDTLIYGWWLVIAAMASDRDLSRGVEIAAHAIALTSQRFMRPR